MFTFESHIIMASSYHKVSILAPFLTITVPDDPVLGVVDRVYSPTEDDYRVVQVLPRFSLVIQSLVAHIFCGLCLLFVRHLVENLKPIGGDQTLVVSSEDIWSLEFGVEHSVPKDFLHHFLLGGLPVSTANIVGS